MAILERAQREMNPFGRSRSAGVRFYEQSQYNLGSDPLAYLDPSYSRFYSDFPAFTSYWDLRNEYKVALYPIRVAPTAEFKIWDKYKVRRLENLYANVDTSKLESNRVSPELLNTRGGFYQLGTKFQQYYVTEYDGQMSLIRIDYIFRALSEINIASEFDIDTGNRFRDWIYRQIARLGETSEEVQEQSIEEDEGGLLGALTQLLGFILDSDLSDIVGLWVPTNFEVIPIPLDDRFAFRVDQTTGQKNGDSAQGPETSNLLPLALIGGGLFTGFLPATLLGGGLLLFSNRGKSTADEDEVPDFTENPNIREAVTVGRTVGPMRLGR